MSHQQSHSPQATQYQQYQQGPVAGTQYALPAPSPPTNEYFQNQYAPQPPQHQQQQQHQSPSQQGPAFPPAHLTPQARIEQLEQQVSDLKQQVKDSRGHFFYSTVVNPDGIKVRLRIDTESEHGSQFIPYGYTLTLIGPPFSIDGDDRLWMRAVFDKTGDKIMEISERYVCLVDDKNNVSLETLHLTLPSIAPARGTVFANRLNVRYKLIEDDEDLDGLDGGNLSSICCCWNAVARLFRSKKVKRS